MRYLLTVTEYPPLLMEMWRGLLTNLLIAILMVVLGKTALKLHRIVLQLWKSKSEFRLTGIWVGTCWLPAYGPEKAIEIYRLVVKSEKLTLTLHSYLPKKCEKCEGAGIVRGRILSAYYYTPTSHDFESGVFLLRQVGKKLRGVYAQYDLRADERLVVSPENFELMRIQVPMATQLRMIMGRKPVATYEEAKKFYDEAVSEHEMPISVPETS